jgi:hypothetical protein
MSGRAIGSKTYVALAADGLLAVVLGSESLEGGLNDTTTQTEDQVESGLLKCEKASSQQNILPKNHINPITIRCFFQRRRFLPEDPETKSSNAANNPHHPTVPHAHNEMKPKRRPMENSRTFWIL